MINYYELCIHIEQIYLIISFFFGCYNWILTPIHKKNRLIFCRINHHQLLLRFLRNTSVIRIAFPIDNRVVVM